MCHLTHVRCHVSHDRCHVSCVTCQVSHVTPNSKTVRARKLKFLENVHLLSPVTCHVSCAMCHILRVTCHMSHDYFFIIFFGQSGKARWWRVCYQRGLPRLVFTLCMFQKLEYQPHFHLPTLSCISHFFWAFQVIWVWFSSLGPRASFEDICEALIG